MNIHRTLKALDHIRGYHPL